MNSNPNNLSPGLKYKNVPPPEEEISPMPENQPQETQEKPTMTNNFALSSFTLDNGKILTGDAAEKLIQVERDVEEAKDEVYYRSVDKNASDARKKAGDEELHKKQMYFSNLKEAMTKQYGS